MDTKADFYLVLVIFDRRKIFVKNIRKQFSCRIRRKILSDKNSTNFRRMAVTSDSRKLFVRISALFWLKISERADIEKIKFQKI